MKESKSALQKWKKGLGKTRSGLLKALFGNSGKVDDVFFEELEEALILSDAGVPATEDLLERLTAVVREERIKDREEARLCLKQLIADDLQPESDFPADVGPACLLIVGVNGVGKTTTIGKMAYQYGQEGRNVILAAADTSARRQRNSSGSGRNGPACRWFGTRRGPIPPRSSMTRSHPTRQGRETCS